MDSLNGISVAIFLSKKETVFVLYFESALSKLFKTFFLQRKSHSEETCLLSKMYHAQGPFFFLTITDKLVKGEDCNTKDEQQMEA